MIIIFIILYILYELYNLYKYNYLSSDKYLINQLEENFLNSYKHLDDYKILNKYLDQFIIINNSLQNNFNQSTYQKLLHKKYQINNLIDSFYHVIPNNKVIDYNKFKNNIDKHLNTYINNYDDNIITYHMYNINKSKKNTYNDLL
jgi:hypothetical protein